jgi:hypothetical protein
MNHENIAAETPRDLGLTVNVLRDAARCDGASVEEPAGAAAARPCGGGCRGCGGGCRGCGGGCRGCGGGCRGCEGCHGCRGCEGCHGCRGCEACGR